MHPIITTDVITAADERRIAVAADCHPQSVNRYFTGKLRSRSVTQRIERALRRLGLTHLLRRIARSREVAP